MSNEQQQHIGIILKLPVPRSLNSLHFAFFTHILVESHSFFSVSVIVCKCVSAEVESVCILCYILALAPYLHSYSIHSRIGCLAAERKEKQKRKIGSGAGNLQFQVCASKNIALNQ